MDVVSEGFSGALAEDAPPLPPGQYLVHDFPVLSAGPTPVVPPRAWEFTIVSESGQRHLWDFASLLEEGSEQIEIDLHCVTGWSKLGTHWGGVPVDALMEKVGETAAEHTLAHSYGGYTTNIPLADLLDGRAWLAHEYDGEPLEPEHGGPVRLLVPHLYLWKSAKWLRQLDLTLEPEVGFWESLGYHSYGDPWLEQRYWSD
jgi:DMSO/TMAO reductase YedYZ molybdopterin-dependent catalytic subunit